MKNNTNMLSDPQDKPLMVKIGQKIGKLSNFNLKEIAVKTIKIQQKFQQ